MAQALAPISENPDFMLLPDRFDGDAASTAEQDVRNFIHNGVRELVLDFTHVTYMTANGMHVLLSLAKALHAVQGRLMVHNIVGQPKDLFDSCSFDAIIPGYAQLCSQEDEAMARMAA